MKSFFKQMLKILAFFILKKVLFVKMSELALISKQPALFTDPIFSNGFALAYFEPKKYTLMQRIAILC